MRTSQVPSQASDDAPLARVDHFAVRVGNIAKALAGLPKHVLLSQSPTRAVVRFHNVALVLLAPGSKYDTHVGFTKIPIPADVRDKVVKHHVSDNTVTVSYDAGGLRIESVFR